MANKKLILASASPRRRELLSMIGWSFRVEPALDEIPKTLPPRELVRGLALEKAKDVWQREGTADTVTLGADTIVVCGGKTLGKPHNIDEAVEMLKMLQGRMHEVYTGIALVEDARYKTSVECTSVYFGAMTKEQIEAYVATGEPMDKAGAYGIQGIGGQFITGIKGCYFNVMGLPLFRLCALFASFTGQEKPLRWEDTDT